MPVRCDARTAGLAQAVRVAVMWRSLPPRERPVRGSRPFPPRGLSGPLRCSAPRSTGTGPRGRASTSRPLARSPLDAVPGTRPRGLLRQVRTRPGARHGHKTPGLRQPDWWRGSGIRRAYPVRENGSPGYAFVLQPRVERFPWQWGGCFPGRCDQPDAAAELTLYVRRPVRDLVW